MRLTLPCLLLLLTVPGWSLAQEVGDPVPRPEARPDAATSEGGDAVDGAAKPETVSPASVNEANSRKTNDPEAGEREPASPEGGALRKEGADAEPTAAPSSIGTEQPNQPDAEQKSISAKADAVPLPEARPDNGEAPEDAASSSTDASPSKTAPQDDSLPSPSRTKLKSVTPATAVRAAGALLASEECEARLEKLGVIFATGKSINTGSCGVLRPVSVTRLSNGIAVRSETQMWCPVADALERWVTSAVEPAAKTYFPDRTLTGLARVSTYVCRNRGSGEKISEHARGAAIDIGAFVFEDTEVPVSNADPQSPEGKFLQEVREAACGPFTTVLGPGTDADHASHFHFDLAARSNGPYCR
ncbi:extensin family protein [Fulvimarina sp. MAC3]|uniref:extensin-like domain-containing protein n=1 Tax=Fulvimarina sp. MAC3 TaxID=3148887 RepID=UPI0031FD8180